MAGRLAPVSEAMNPPKPSLERKEGGLEKKRPQEMGTVLTPQSPSPKPCASLYTYLCFPLICRWKAWQRLSKGMVSLH